MQARDIYLDGSSALPVYEQLREQILHAIARGALRRGDQLPAVRELAAALHINPNTVNRAYAELERDGTLRAQRGIGTFVSDRRHATVAPHRGKLLDLAERFIAQARALGFQADSIGRAVATQLRKQRL